MSCSPNWVSPAGDWHEGPRPAGSWDLTALQLEGALVVHTLLGHTLC